MNTQMINALSSGDNTPVVLVGCNEKFEAKVIDFCGDELLVVKDNSNNKVYTGIGYICKGIGFSKDQKDRQVKNIQSDIVLNRGCVKFDAGVIDKNNEVLAIDIDYLPIWLAKISITPNMKEQHPEVVERLVEYQLKAKDVLAQAFIHNNQIDLSEYSEEMQAILIQDKKLKRVEQRVNNLEDNIHISRHQKKQLREFISTVVVNSCGSRYSKAFKEFGKKAYSAAYHDLYNAFGVSSYEEIPKIKFQDALAFINRWAPSRELALLIKGSNSEVLNE